MSPFWWVVPALIPILAIAFLYWAWGKTFSVVYPIGLLAWAMLLTCLVVLLHYHWI